MKNLLVIPLLFLVCSIAAGQDEFKETRGDVFHSAVLKAARARIEHAKTGADTIKARIEYWRIRKAMLLPKMRAEIKELAEMAIVLEVKSGDSSPAVPIVDGEVDTASIDWDQLLEFLEALIPIILLLLEIFG